MSTEKEERLGTIYIITCIVTGLIYIGQTTQSLNRRLSGHISAAYCKDRRDYSSRLHVAIREFGKKAFKIEALDENIPKSQLCDLERKWILKLHSSDPAIGYNYQDGRKVCDVNAYERARYAKLPQEKKDDRKCMMREWYAVNREEHSQYMREYMRARRAAKRMSNSQTKLTIEEELC